MTHAELRQLLEAQAVAAAEKHGALAKQREAIFSKLAATSSNVPHGRLSELAELVRGRPTGFERALGEIGISFLPRHAVEFVTGMIGRLQSQGSSANLYAPRHYREVLRR